MKWGEMIRKLKRFWVQILALILLLSGIFFFTDWMRLVKGLAHLTARILRNVNVAHSLFSTFLKSVLSNPSNIIGLTLIFMAMLILARIRVRKYINNSSTYWRRKCPVCNESLRRAHQKPLDRLIRLFVPLRRYECVNFRCGWNSWRATMGRRRHWYILY